MSRAVTGSCPGCGAQITLRAADSVLVVCEYCSTSCIREGDGLDKAGVMGALFDDHSPLTLGAVGRFNGKSFSLVGRLQYRYEDGVWNEWRVLIEDGEAAWLSEDNGSYSFSMPRGSVEAPSFDSITTGHELKFEDTVYRVTYKERATVIAGAGELPFVVGSGYDAPVCDLRGPNGEIATLDYSDLVASPAQPAQDAAVARPLLYLGRAVALADLDLQGLSGDRTRRVRLQAFSCPKCGATVAPRLNDTQSLTCGSCASLLDVSSGLGEKIRLVEQQAPPQIDIPLGSEGTFDQIRWTVVGYMRRRGNDGEDVFGWEEYLLHNEQAGFRFLNLDSGHWSLGRIAQKSFEIATDQYDRGYVEHDGRRYDQYAWYTATVTYVIGEFFWQVRMDDKARLIDFICPPYSLSREQEAQEVVWTESQRLPGEQVAEAFGLSPDSMPAEQGPGMLAEFPPSYKQRYPKMALVALSCLIAIQALFMMMGSNTQLVGMTGLAFESTPGRHQVTLTGERRSNLEVAVISEVYNNSFGVSAELIPAGSRDVWEVSTEIGYYAGYEGGESWSEGDQDGRLVFSGLSPGRYTLAVTAERFDKTKQAPLARYSVLQQGRPLWLPFLIAVALVIALGIYGWLKEPDPLGQRWGDSQYGSKPGWYRLYQSSADRDDQHETDKG